MNCEKRSISRRNFLAGAAGAAALGATGSLFGCAPQTADSAEGSGKTVTSGLPEKWDRETDIIVVGGGGGGLVAACRAKDLGSEAILLEKSASLGGDTFMPAQVAQGFWESRVADGDSVDLYIEDMKNSHWATEKGIAGEPLVDDLPLTRTWAESSSAMYDWTDSLGMEWADSGGEHQAFYPQPQWDTKTPRSWRPAGGSITNVMQKAANDLGVEILLSTPATRLITNDDSRVVGVYALDSKDNIVALKAKQAVILACGGFNASRGMMARYLPEQGTGFCGGCDGNTGDGHSMVQAIGGQLKDMGLGTHWMVYDDASYTTLYNAAVGSYGGTENLADAADFPFILVNLNGERFMAETMGYKWVGYHTNNQPFHMNYFLFDSGDASNAWFDTAAQALGGTDAVKLIEANTIEEIASKMQVPGDALTETVTRYNGFVENGSDEDFGRSMRKIGKLDTPPYRAVRMRPRHYTTYGGIAIDTESHVLDTSNSVIPGLYAAGTCCGAIVEQEGLYYQGGVGQTLTFGYIAGEHAAEEKPWE